jgi:hypothetical protein
MTTTVVVFVSVEVGALVSLSHGFSSVGVGVGIPIDDFVSYPASFDDAVYIPPDQED